MIIFSTSQGGNFDRRMYYILTTASVPAFFLGWILFSSDYPRVAVFQMLHWWDLCAAIQLSGFQGESKRCGCCPYFHFSIAEV